MRVLTEVSGDVAAERAADLQAAFTELLAAPLPDGLLRTQLLRGPDGHWRIQTLWRDRDALDAMRSGGEPPAAPRLLREAGAEPVLTIWEVVGALD